MDENSVDYYVDYHKVLSIVAEMEETLLHGTDSPWNDVFVELMEGNTFRLPCFEHGYSLTRARRMEDDAKKPYVSDEIGMKKIDHPDRINKNNRWGEMIYLSTDLHYRSTFKEKGISCKKGTLGYFFVKDTLNLYDATEPRAISDACKIYNGINADTALTAFIVLIQKWFNAGQKQDDDTVFTITNHVAWLIRTKTKLDGIVYKSTKNPDNWGWNVALIDQNKIEWGYSDLMVLGKDNRYHRNRNRTEKNDKDDCYDRMKSFTIDMREILAVQPKNPVQARGILYHHFP